MAAASQPRWQGDTERERRFIPASPALWLPPAPGPFPTPLAGRGAAGAALRTDGRCRPRTTRGRGGPQGRLRSSPPINSVPSYPAGTGEPRSLAVSPGGQPDPRGAFRPQQQPRGPVPLRRRGEHGHALPQGAWALGGGLEAPTVLLWPEDPGSYAGRAAAGPQPIPYRGNNGAVQRALEFLYPLVLVRGARRAGA